MRKRQLPQDTVKASFRGGLTPPSLKIHRDSTTAPFRTARNSRPQFRMTASSLKEPLAEAAKVLQGW